MTKLFYQGHASFRLTTNDGKTIYIDPFANVGFDQDANLVLITHEHFDHNQLDLVPLASDCVVIRSRDMLRDGAHLTREIDGIAIESTPASNVNHPVTECVGYLVSVDGLLLYFAGDTSTTSYMKDNLSARNIDYAFLPCDGVYNMDRPEAEACAAAIGAAHTVPIHTAPSHSSDQCSFDLEKALAFEAPGKVVIQPGEEIEL